MTNQTAAINAKELAVKIDSTLQNLRENFDVSNLAKEDKSKLMQKISEAERLANEILDLSKK